MVQLEQQLNTQQQYVNSLGLMIQAIQEADKLTHLLAGAEEQLEQAQAQIKLLLAELAIEKRLHAMDSEAEDERDEEKLVLHEVLTGYASPLRYPSIKVIHQDYVVAGGTRSEAWVRVMITRLEDKDLVDKVIRRDGSAVWKILW
jgi:hypothetical protein